ncbi:hypothetical protein N9V56_03470 [Alphaproteobacteria bacterium]|nr:hypothetical protein [Alphaproteobacteria bacterium]
MDINYFLSNQGASGAVISPFGILEFSVFCSLEIKFNFFLMYNLPKINAKIIADTNIMIPIIG